MHRIIEDIYFLGKYLSDPSAVKRRKSQARLQMYINGERIYLSEDIKQCFRNPTIELGEEGD